MCPQRFVPDFYDPEKLRLLQQVFDRVWDQFAVEYPNRDLGKDEDLRASLAKSIVDSATEGEIDPERLKETSARTLASLVSRS